MIILWAGIRYAKAALNRAIGWAWGRTGTTAADTGAVVCVLPTLWCAPPSVATIDCRVPQEQTLECDVPSIPTMDLRC